MVRILDSSEQSAQPWRTGFCAGFIILITVALYLPVINLTKSWDDDITIFQNRRLNPPRPQVLPLFWTRPHLDLYIPITHTVWWCIAHIAGQPTLEGFRLDPRIFHAANVLVHVLVSLLVFVVLRRLVKNDWAACAGALLFAIHPVQVEPVAWISGMKDLLCGLLVLIALDRYLAAVSGPMRDRLNYVATLFAFMAAMLSKPTAVVLPLILLAVDYFALRRSIRLILRDLLPFVLLAIPCLIWTALAQPAHNVTTLVSLHLRPLVALDALAFYLWKLIWPVDLAVDYGRTPRVVLDHGWIWWTWIAPLSVGAAIVILRRRLPLLVAGACIFVAALLPILGLRRFDFQTYSTVSDRYLYLPMFGVALGASALLVRVKPAAVRWVLGSVVLLALAGANLAQSSHWKSSQALFERTMAVNPRSWWACNNLATVALLENRDTDAEKFARQALTLGGTYHAVHLNLGEALKRQEKLDDATREFEQAVRLRPDLLEPRVLLAGVYFQAGRLDDSIEQLQAAVKIEPRDEKTQRLLKQVSAHRDSLRRGSPLHLR